MTWIVGIDEAGYGPNLGPLVMSSVACQLPTSLASTSLWSVLRRVVRRQSSDDDGRLLIDDSKLVYSTARGLRSLEVGVAATLPTWPKEELITFEHLLGLVAPCHRVDPQAEQWYSGSTILPVESDRCELTSAASRFDRACEKKAVVRGLVRSVVVHASQFNVLLSEWRSKGAVLAQALLDIIRANLEALDDFEPVWFQIDKHGGRNNYAALLQNAIPEGLVIADEERTNRSVYHVLGLERQVRFTFQPRADSEHFCVAIASMISKYLREIFMIEFNIYWQEHIPGLERTAGYYGDASRFYSAVRPAMERLGITEECVWRRR
jgi:hypothetical protein